VHAEVSGRQSTLRAELLPSELALREPGHGTLQAVRQRPGGVRQEVLQQVDDVLRRPVAGPVLQEERVVVPDRSGGTHEAHVL
jgi:hypothetical protein